MASILNVKNLSPGEFFAYLFMVRDLVHLTHLAQPDKKLSTHLALGDLYEGMLPLIDELVEVYTGVYGVPIISIPTTKATKTISTDLQGCYQYIEQHKTIFKETWILNIIDEISTLIAKTLYKLKFVQ